MIRSHNVDYSLRYNNGKKIDKKQYDVDIKPNYAKNPHERLTLKNSKFVNFENFELLNSIWREIE